MYRRGQLHFTGLCSNILQIMMGVIPMTTSKYVKIIQNNNIKRLVHMYKGEGVRFAYFISFFLEYPMKI